VTVFFRVAGPLAWPDARENGMTVTTAREVPDDRRADLVTVPVQAGGQDAGAARERAATSGNLERAPALVAAVGPGSS
jgi:hypothetical protein